MKANKIFNLAAAMLLSSGFILASFSSMAVAEEKEILYWVAPMDPNYKRDKPGKSPMGMDLIPVYAGEEGQSASTVTISPAVVENLGVRTARSERTRLWRGIDTVGYVDYDESKVSHIHLRTEGWIEKLTVESEGDRVKKGQFLFDVYSPLLVSAQDELVTALNTGNKNLINASKERLSALGISDKQIRELTKTRKVKQIISVYAPQDGVVSHFPVRDGMFVKPTNDVMTLADLSSVWVLAEVFERQADWVEVGQQAEVRLSYIPGRVWEGKVEYIYPTLDPKTRTLKVRLRFDNPGEKLKPNMYANIKIYGGATEDTIVIPLEALIRTGREERVIISLGDGRFEARQVTAGIESGDYVEILEGLDAGETVVTSAQFLIDSEASMRASLNRMEDPAKEAADTAVKSVTGSGVVQSINMDEKTINLQHEPIDELGWPAMTMDFDVMPDVDLGQLSVNEKVMFQLEKHGDNYMITSIHAMTEDMNGARDGSGNERGE
ncbi:MAG TPA: efflux RND transporter periplasmic adaptor subunit [Gammaproteobacteria bacterium]|nr:efflux RND transporter periplasmic adaptor subunit [Gammaproteobacteria bacterium]